LTIGQEQSGRQPDAVGHRDPRCGLSHGGMVAIARPEGSDSIRRVNDGEFEVAVVGLGGFGSGALYWLSRRLGADVIGLEQFELGHERGASQDHSRIVRLSYHRPFYVELAKLAFGAWSEVEAEAGERLI